MNDDSIRAALYTTFVCAKCGKNLKISYDIPAGSSQSEAGQPTGAAMVHSKIAIHPCESCMRPLSDVRGALKTIIDAASV